MGGEFNDNEVTEGFSNNGVVYFSRHNRRGEFVTCKGVPLTT